MLLRASMLLLLTGCVFSSCTAKKNEDAKVEVSLQYEKNHSVSEDANLEVDFSILADGLSGNCADLTFSDYVDTASLLDTSNISFQGTLPSCKFVIPTKTDLYGTGVFSFKFVTSEASYLISVNISVTSVQDIYGLDISENNNRSHGSICVNSKDGVYCWGNNNSRQLGFSDYDSRWSPTSFLGTTSNQKSLDVGHRHICYVDSSNDLFCVGTGTYGQLGNASNSSSVYTPQSVIKNSDDTTLTNVESVSAGYLSTCAVLTDKTVWCWGYNSYGGLGDNSTTQRNKAVQVLKNNGAGGTEALTNVSKVVNAGVQSCALREDQSVWCWGRSNYGQLANNSTGNQLVAEKTFRDNGAGGVEEVVDAVDVSLGSLVSCYVSSSGQVYCAGSSSNGRLGNGSTSSNYSVYQKVIKDSDLSDLDNGVSVDAGVNHTCAITSSGGMYCWGENAWGQLGNGKRQRYNSRAVEVKHPENSSLPISDVTMMAVGSKETCAVMKDRLYCWGASGIGLIQNSSVLANSLDLLESNLTDFKAFPSGFSTDYQAHTCYINTSDKVKCIGNNQFGQLGQNNRDSLDVASLVKNEDNSGELSNISSLSVATGHNCAISSGQAYCWGGGSYVLGDGGGYVEKSLPVKVIKKAGGDLNSLDTVAAGSYHSCAKETSGKIWCWGTNTYGQLGANDTSIHLGAVEVYKDNLSGGTELFTTGSKIAVSSYNSCAIDNTGQVWCWGRGYSGANANASSANTSFATRAYRDNLAGGQTLINDAIDITSGPYGFCVIRDNTNKEVWCWGLAAYGNLGNGSTAAQNIAKQVIDSSANPIQGITKLSGSFYSICALDSSSQVYCWGNSKFGQLGNLNSIDATRTAAAFVPDSYKGSSPITGVSDLFVSAKHVCVKKTDEKVYCWGENGQGQSYHSKLSSSSLPLLVDYTAD
jgi:alpha-tubulin suppressor-like RCC1 family protein